MTHDTHDTHDTHSTFFRVRQSVLPWGKPSRRAVLVARRSWTSQADKPSGHSLLLSVSESNPNNSQNQLQK